MNKEAWLIGSSVFEKYAPTMVTTENRRAWKAATLDSIDFHIATCDCEGVGVAIAEDTPIITLWQPYATALVMEGFKANETRSWSTKVRGPVLIHAAKRWGVDQRYVCEQEHGAALCYELGGGYYSDILPRGAIVGAVWIDKVVPAVTEYVLQSDIAASGMFTDKRTAQAEREIAFGDYSGRRFAWKTTRRIRFKTPIFYKGQQGFFKFKHADRVIA